MRTLLITLSIVYVFTPCTKSFLEQDNVEPIFVRVPDYTEEVWVKTNREMFVIKVKEGDCLSCIVEQCIDEYLEDNGYKGLFNFGETLLNITYSIITISGDPNLIYPGEVISFKLPVEFKVMKFEYYRPAKRIYGVDSLKKALDFDWLIPYHQGMWNCSESSSFVEYYLTNRGYTADIVYNYTHSWVIVEVEPNEWVNVECSSSPPEVGKAPEDYIFRYKDIWEAIEAEPEEFDWWNAVEAGVVIGRKKH